MCVCPIVYVCAECGVCVSRWRLVPITAEPARHMSHAHAHVHMSTRPHGHGHGHVHAHAHPDVHVHVTCAGRWPRLHVDYMGRDRASAIVAMQAAWRLDG